MQKFLLYAAKFLQCLNFVNLHFIKIYAQKYKKLWFAPYFLSDSQNFNLLKILPYTVNLCHPN